jgi:sugar phosphate permease
VNEARAKRGAIVTAFAVTWLAYATYYLGRMGFSVSNVCSLSHGQPLGPRRVAMISTSFSNFAPVIVSHYIGYATFNS